MIEIQIQRERGLKQAHGVHERDCLMRFGLTAQDFDFNRRRRAASNRLNRGRRLQLVKRGRPHTLQ